MAPMLPRPDLAQVKAILFDTFGSVVDWRGSLIADLSAWAATRGISGDWAGLVDAWRAAYAPSMDRHKASASPPIGGPGAPRRAALDDPG